MNTIEIIERGEASVPRTTWEALRGESSFWQLVDAKVLTPRMHRDGSITLAAGNQVGLAQCGETLIVVVEKIPGALASLLGHDMTSVRSMSVPGRLSPMLTLIDHVVDALLGAVHQYVSDGRDWSYERVRRQGSTIGGRLLVPETLLLRATGRPQVLAFEKRRITHVTPTNQVVAASLRMTESLHAMGLLGAAALGSARSLAAFFNDNQTSEVLYGDRLLLAAGAAELSDGAQGNKARMLSLASVLLSGAGIGIEQLQDRRLPITWFVNLETLFESVARSLLRRRLGANWCVEKGGEVAFLFSDPNYLNVDPDLVATREGDCRTRLVGDVKYKDLVGQPSASDLYQLIAHSKALDSDTAFLIYPGTFYSHKRIGTAATGVTVDVALLDVMNLEVSIDNFVRSMQKFA